MTTSASIDLAALLAEKAPLSNLPLVLCDAELDTPLGYIFESDGAESWIEAVGAGKQLATLPGKLSAALPTGSVTLQSDTGRLVALVPDSGELAWTTRLAQIPPHTTGVTTLSVGVMRLTSRQVFGGLYHAPENVIGIPGMTVHQARVNRYYHVESPSTVPPADRVAARRHFGEAIRLVRHLAKRAHEERALVPFYECLPVVERCISCRTRPAEPGLPDKALCGICRRKHEAAGKRGNARWTAVITIRLPHTNKLLLEQRTPGSYQRMATTITEAWRYAVFEAKKRSVSLETLWQSSGTAWLIAPAAEALAAVQALCTALAAAHLPPNMAAVCVGIALGECGARTLYRVAEMAMADALSDMAKSGSASAIRLRLVNESSVYQPGASGDDLRYSLEALGRLNTAAHNLATRHFPLDAFSELPDILARQTAQAALYFEHTRARLDERAQRLLDPLLSEFSAAWGAGTARYFHAIADVFGLQALMQQAIYS